jgi:hypothetical protein
MADKRAVMLVRMDSPLEKEVEWNDWYNSVHIPGRLAIPGFLTARRFELSEGLPEKFIVPGPKYLTIYELANTDALSSKLYLELQEKEASLPPDSFEAITRKLPGLSGGVYEQIYPEERTYEIPEGAKYLLAVGHADLAPKIIEEYNAWYNTEHIPSYVDIPGFINARRFQIAKGKAGLLPGAQLPAPDFIALYDLANGEVFETEEFKQRSSTPWSTRIRQWTWDRRKMNNMYRCIYIAKQ